MQFQSFQTFKIGKGDTTPCFLYYYSSKFARPAKIIWKLKALGVGNSSRRDAKSPSSEGKDKNSYE